MILSMKKRLLTILLILSELSCTVSALSGDKMSVSAAEVQTIEASDPSSAASAAQSSSDPAGSGSASGVSAAGDSGNNEQNPADAVFSADVSAQTAVTDAAAAASTDPQASAVSGVSASESAASQTGEANTGAAAASDTAAGSSGTAAVAVTPSADPAGASAASAAANGDASAASTAGTVTAPAAGTEITAPSVPADTGVTTPIVEEPVVITETTEYFPAQEPVYEEYLDDALEEAMKDEIDEDLSEEQGRDPDAWLYSDDFTEVSEGVDARYVRAGMSGNELKLFRFLTERLGLNTAAACGVLANVYCESGFSTSAIGDHGTSVGICQWHNGRKKAALAYLDDNGYERNSLAGQMFYMREELNGGYRAVYDYLAGVPDTAEGAYQAGRYFCLYYEIPANRQNASKSRGNLAKKTFWAAYAEGREEVTVLVKQTKAASDKAAAANTAEQKTTEKSTSTKKVEIDLNDNDAAQEGSIPEGIWILGLKDSYAYEGKAVKPDICVYDGVKLLTKNEDYKVAYQHYDEVGTAKIRITTMGDNPREIIREYRIAYTEETAPKILPGGFLRGGR